MAEYRIGDRVRFLSTAAVSDRVLGLIATVEGYDAVRRTDISGRAQDVDFVIVSVRLNGKPTEQWVLPREITPA